MVTLELVFPFLRERFPTHRRYGSATFQQIFAGQLTGAKLIKASRLASVVLLNRGGKFESRPLPVEAQLTPVMGASVAPTLTATATRTFSKSKLFCGSL